ncbi:MAG TPA: sulfurtransferase [Dermatophilaceae bacterium]|jgi:thiosulfate/3-mercaptopyruvate sulfurtransferase
MDPSPLIRVDELQRLLAGREVSRPVVLDVRFRLGSSTGREEFEDAHIPGASYVDMDTELATIRADGAGGRHPMPTVETFTAAMRSVGVTLSRPVVAYDGWCSLPASRVWWMLRHLGFPDVRVLDGGIEAWAAAGQPTESGPSTPAAGDFTPSGPGIGRILDAAGAERYAARHLLFDARPADRFRGENETIDAVAGHIPGSVSAPALANVDRDGRFLPADQLAALFRRLGAADAKRVGTYCGSGIQAAHLALALSVAGITDGADVYVGSWSDWITDPERPVEV